MALLVTRRFSFSYGHFLPDYEGKCKVSHGHNAIVEVTFEHHPNLERYPSMVLDFGTIKKHVGPILDELDHSFLNDHAECRPGGELEHPTAESMALYIARRIVASPVGLGFVKLRISETDDAWVDFVNREVPV